MRKHTFYDYSFSHKHIYKCWVEEAELVFRFGIYNLLKWGKNEKTCCASGNFVYFIVLFLH